MVATEPNPSSASWSNTCRSAGFAMVYITLVLLGPGCSDDGVHEPHDAEVDASDADADQDAAVCGDPGGLSAQSPWPMFRRCGTHVARAGVEGSNTNEVRWRFLTAGLVVGSPAIAADGTIYVGSVDHNLYAIAADGSLNWAFDADDEIRSTPAIGVDGTVYIGADDGNVYAIRADGGEEWRFQTTGRAVRASPVIGPDGAVYVTVVEAGLLALEPDGTFRWLYPAAATASSPAQAADGTLYFGTSEGTLEAVDSEGMHVWSAALGGGVHTSSPAIGPDGTVYIWSEEGDGLHALWPTGDTRWVYSAPSMLIGTSSPAVGAQGVVYIGSPAGLHAIGSNGLEVWLVEIAGGAGSPVLDSEGNIYVGSGSGFHAVGPDGAPRWELEIDGGTARSAAVGADGTLYVGGACHKVYAVGVGGGAPPEPDPPPRWGQCGMAQTRVWCNYDAECSAYCGDFNTCHQFGYCLRTEPGSYYCTLPPGGQCLGAPGLVCSFNGLCSNPCLDHGDCPGGICICEGGAAVCSYYRCEGGACPVDSVPEAGSLACIVDASSLEGDCHNVSGTCDAIFVPVGDRGCVRP